ncbi:hypothetical protein [Winogradskyella sp. PE311]|uniref:hypothetical protein n=1 Tax=Winogradskyella sp. PE311 TaxID=3366943 RepID=UPI00397FB12F
MKTKGIILILTVLLFSSCIVKSLQPFYIKDSLSFNKALLGNWTDNKKGQWTVEAIKDKFEEDRKEGVELSEEDLLFLDTYKKGYYIKLVSKEKEAGFIAMPFLINEQYFLDFIPLEIEDDEINSLAAQHLLKTHSVAKLDIESDTKVSFSWLSEKPIGQLFDENQIRLKHEKIGIEEDLLLTASSKELYAFLDKFMKSNVKNKWGEDTNKKTSSDRFTLTRTNAKP